MTEYLQFLQRKKARFSTTGKQVDRETINPILFPFQRDLVAWACHKGRAAIFADTGLGKTFMQLEWSRLMGEDTLIIAPLAVSKQTIQEGAKLGIEVHYIRHDAEARPGICITNYEMGVKMDLARYRAVILDESSILKGLTGKTRQHLTEMCIDVPYRLCCTATPAPNDISEIANHAEFLGVMSRADMLATFFVHDEQEWRLKGHATERFYEWLSSWGMSIRKPSDLGYEDDGFVLPPLNVHRVIVPSDYHPEDSLFFLGMKGITDRIAVRRGTIEERVRAAAELVNQSPDDQWIVWCGLNRESSEAAAALPDAIEVVGADSIEVKQEAIEGFQDGRHRVLITKGRIAGFGMNLQNAHKMIFLGLNDSWESYYQCIRRCYRFLQQHPVDVYVVLSDLETEIYQNVMRKNEMAQEMSEQLIRNVQGFKMEELRGEEEGFTVTENTVEIDEAKIMLGDSVERLSEVEDDSVSLSVFSPPFLSLYTYSPTERDIGNSRGPDEFKEHFGYIIDHLLRITKPGRNCACHVSQVPAMLARDGYIGLKDFRGLTIQLFEDHGWIYHGEVVVDKDPQAQAIRTKSKALLFTQLRKDSSWLRPALADYILVFRKPGNNAVPIHPDLVNNEWIEWARPIWYGIRESDTLNIAEAREDKDERHICPLQLGVIERIIRLWSNPEELVCSPFMGIGSEGYEAVRLGRRFVGCELKESYFRAAVRNIKSVSALHAKQLSMFS